MVATAAEQCKQVSGQTGWPGLGGAEVESSKRPHKLLGMHQKATKRINDIHHAHFLVFYLRSSASMAARHNEYATAHSGDSLEALTASLTADLRKNIKQLAICTILTPAWSAGGQALHRVARVTNMVRNLLEGGHTL